MSLTGALRARAIAGLAGVLLALLPPVDVAQETQPGGGAVATPQQLRERMLAIARSYADFAWQGSARNVLHGPDANGTQVDTPDISFDPKGWKTDGTNHGMPYAWGGFTSIEEFGAGLAQGQPAGHVPASERARPSASALGLDCSGFIARCWDLPVKQSTRSLGALCYPLADQAALQPGDILDLFDSHVVLFERWLDAEHTRMKVFEAARLSVAESEYAADELQRLGFQPLRYKPLDERWIPMLLDGAAFSAGATAVVGRWTAQGEGLPLERATVASPLADSQPLEWARYAVTGDDAQHPGDCERATLVAAVDGGRVDTQTETHFPGGSISTGRSCEHPQAVIDALLDFAAPDEPLSAITVSECTITPGQYELAGRTFPAQRVEARLLATHVVRHQDLPVTITLDGILSPEVAVHGVLQASLAWETVWSSEPGKAPVIGRHASRYQLREFGGPRR